MTEESGELRDGELLGAGVRAKIQRSESFANCRGLGERAQVVHQGFALLRETQFHKIKETRFIGEAELCALAGEAERDEGRGNFRRRRESVARKFKNKFGARIELREDGEIAVVSPARLRGEACRDFGLDDDVNFVNEIREREEALED